MDYVKQIEQYKQENEKLKAERDFLTDCSHLLRSADLA